MRILVTGAAGFLGSYVAAELGRRAHEVFALLRPATDPRRLIASGAPATIVRGSVGDTAGLREILAATRPEAVVHLAWEGVGNRDRNAPAQARNIPATVDLLDLAADAGATVFVGAGSQAEYGRYDRPIREDDATRPSTLYGHAKLAAGTMAGKLAAERGIRYAWLRVFSTYGPGDNPGWLIRDLIAKLRSGQPMALTRGDQHWGFLHARDAATGFAKVVENRSAAGVFNLGSPDAPLLRDTILALRDIANPVVELRFGEIPYRPDQVMTLAADVERLRALGWEPRTTLRAGLAETVAADAAAAGA